MREIRATLLGLGYSIHKSSATRSCQCVISRAALPVPVSVLYQEQRYPFLSVFYQEQRYPFLSVCCIFVILGPYSVQLQNVDDSQTFGICWAILGCS